jgi:hypothetical protein
MLKFTYLSLLQCLVLIATAFGQPARLDSLIKVARADAKSFKLDDAIWKKYRHRLPATSDYFKPSEANFKNGALLADSDYVGAYRKAAFKKNKHRHTSWHYVLIGGSVATGIAILGLAAIIIFIVPHLE